MRATATNTLTNNEIKYPLSFYVALFTSVLTVITLIGFSWVYGIHREYRFEVAIITIVWIASIISGILLSKLFKRVNIQYRYKKYK